MSKLEYAQQLIKDTVASKPIIAMSFGKDSMVMLDIFIRMGLTLPVVYWRRERHFPLKNQFANKVIEKFNLVAYDFPPIATRLIRGKGLIEVVNYFTVSDSLKTLAIPSGIAPVVEGEPYLCALEDMYNKPKGVCEFYWDTVYIGHKDSDIDPLQGAVPLTCDEFTLDKGPRLCFPLRHFTDDDIWEYSKTYEVIQDTNRYKSDGDEDMTYNNDYYPACTACINPDNPASVWCPKVNRNIENVSSKLNWVESIRPAYWKEQ